MEKSTIQYRPFITINVSNEWAGVSKDLLHIVPDEKTKKIINDHQHLEFSEAGSYQLAFVVKTENEAESIEDVIGNNFNKIGELEKHSVTTCDYASANISDHIFAEDQTLIFQISVSPKFFYPFPKLDDTKAKFAFNYAEPILEIDDPIMEVNRSIDFTIIPVQGEKNKMGISVDGVLLPILNKINLKNNLLAELTLNITANLKNQHHITYNLKFKA